MKKRARRSKLKIRIFLWIFSLASRFPLVYLNEFVRRIYLYKVTYFYSAALNVRAEARNSAHDRSNFNFLVSDLDMAFILEAEAPSQQLNAIKRKVESLKRIFPMVREIETYGFIEYLRTRQLIDDPEIQVLRFYRKAIWMKHRYSDSNSAFDSAKHFRSWRRSFNTHTSFGGIEALAHKYNSSLADLELTSTGPLSFWQIERSEISNLTTRKFLTALDPLTQIPQNSELALLKRKLMEYEWIQTVSSHRVSSENWNYHDNWTKILASHFVLLSK